MEPKIVLAMIVIALCIMLHPIKHHKIDLHFKPLIKVFDVKKQLFNLPLKDVKKVAVVDEPRAESISIKVNRGGEDWTQMFNQRERNMLCSTLYQEAGDEPYRCKVLSCVVMIKRLKHGGYGDTIGDVLFGGSGSQFNGTRSGSFGKFGEDEINAFKEAVSTLNQYPDNLLYFCNPELSTDKKFVRYVESNLYERSGRTIFGLRKEK